MERSNNGLPAGFTATKRRAAEMSDETGWPAQNITQAACLCYVDGADTALRMTQAAAILLRAVSSAALKAPRFVGPAADMVERALAAAMEAERALIDLCAQDQADRRRYES